MNGVRKPLVAACAVSLGILIASFVPGVRKTLAGTNSSREVTSDVCGVKRIGVYQPYKCSQGSSTTDSDGIPFSEWLDKYWDESFELQNSLLLVRHCSRYPTVGESNLEKLIKLFKPKSPIRNALESVKDKNMDFEQLTAKGKNEAFEIGEYLRIMLPLMHGSLKAENVQASCSSIDRTCHTVERILQGLIGVENTKSVGIKRGDFLRQDQDVLDDSTPEFLVDLEKDYSKKIFSKFQDQLRDGAEISPSDWFMIAKTLEINDIIYDENILRSLFTTEDINNIDQFIEIERYHMQSLGNAKSKKDTSKLVGEIISNIGAMQSESSAIKFTIFGSHDNNIIALIDYMDWWNKDDGSKRSKGDYTSISIPKCSNLQFLVFSKPGASERYLLTLQNGRVRPLSKTLRYGEDKSYNLEEFLGEMKQSIANY
ncbi:MAG: hypothetical protein MHMPM18_001945 [Marteilia pararefringens]